MELNNPGQVTRKLIKLFFLVIVIYGICLPAVAFPVNLQDEINNVTGHLAALRSNISEKQSSGVDTSEAENFYNNASQQLASVKDHLASQNYSPVVNDLAAAEASIDAGELAVERAWAMGETMNARVSLDNSLHIVALIGQDTGQVNSSRYREVIAQKDAAENYLAAANIEIANGNYTRGHELAQKAWQAGNESYTGALAIVPKQYTGPEDRWALLKMALSDARIMTISIIAGVVLVTTVAIILVTGKKIRGER